MDRIPPFPAESLEALCKIIGDTNRGLSGTQIGAMLQEIRVADIDPSNTKWKRLYNALATVQNEKQVGNHTVMVINRLMKPTRYLNNQEGFTWYQSELNMVLAFCGFAILDDGRVARTRKETTLAGARKRASRLKSSLAERNVHQEVLTYCRAELLEENYFHAVFEATKSVAQRIRNKTNLQSDGAELVTSAFSGSNPLLRINPLSNDSERSEQRGFANLLIGLFGAIRNPLGHSPKILWNLSEEDALDILTLVSYVHRKLDRIP